MNKFKRDQQLRSYSRDSSRYGADMVKNILTYAAIPVLAYGTYKGGKKMVEEIIYDSKFKQLSLF